jgi:hypothetical protein
MKKVLGFAVMLLVCFVGCKEQRTAGSGGMVLAIDTVMPEPVKPGTEVSTASVIQPAQLIIPGKSIGKTAINADMENILKVFGPPDHGDAAMGKSWSTWVSKPATGETPYETNIYASRNMGVGNEASLVKQIRVTSPYFKTATGIQTGSLLELVSKQFPGIRIVSGAANTGKGSTLYDDVANGIAFEINKDAHCAAIIVHEPAVTVTYIPL